MGDEKTNQISSAAISPACHEIDAGKVDAAQVIIQARGQQLNLDEVVALILV